MERRAISHRAGSERLQRLLWRRTVPWSCWSPWFNELSWRSVSLPLPSYLCLRSVSRGSGASRSQRCILWDGAVQTLPQQAPVDRRGSKSLLKGKVVTSAPEWHWAMPVTEGNKSGGALISVMFGLGSLHANDVKTIFRIEALYQQQFELKQPQCSVPAGRHVLMALQSPQRAHSLQEDRTRGSLGSLSCPATAPCVVQRQNQPCVPLPGSPLLYLPHKTGMLDVQN